MKVSIVTVCRNSEAFIADALDSVDRQTWAAIEHVIVDGASTDGTLAAVRARARPGRSVVSEPDAGIYDAMNKGLARTTGDVVGFLNADDQLAADDAIARIAAAFDADPALMAAWGDLDYVSAGADQRPIRRWISSDFSPARLRHGWMPPHPTFYVRRTLLARVGPFDTGYRIAGDYDFIVRCLTVPGLRTRYLPTLLVRMRVGGASNASLGHMLRKSREDLRIMRRHGIGGVATLVAKNLAKVPQFLARRREAAG